MSGVGKDASAGAPSAGAPAKAASRARRRAPRGPNDPGRRDRIAAAALQVALEQGVGAVSHRTVAAVASVPLGSTTYHFSGLDDLLAAALQRAAAAYAEQLVAWSDAIGDGDVADALCGLVEHGLGIDRDRVVASYELYLAALRRPQLQAVSSAWSELLPLVLGQHVDELTARELAIVVDGVMVNALVTGGTPRRPDLYELLVRVAGR